MKRTPRGCFLTLSGTDELLPGLDHSLGAEIRDVIQVLSDADGELFSTRLERELLGP